MVALIKKDNPDVIGLQEAGDWVGAVKGPRVVDDLAGPARGLHRGPHGGHPGQAGPVSEPPATSCTAPRRTAPWVPVGTGRWRPAGSRPTRSCRTARPGRGSWPCRCTCPPGAGRTADLGRQAETQKLLGFVRTSRPRLTSRSSTSVTSTPTRAPLDGPASRFAPRAPRTPTRSPRRWSTAEYNSANQYLRSPMTRALGHRPRVTPRPVWPSVAGRSR